MNLYCYPCQKIHTYTPSEVERLVYGLQLAEYDAAIYQEEHRNWLELVCLDNILSLAGDSEGYAEAINESMIPARKDLTTLVGRYEQRTA
jgi:hypothetical protein